MAKDIVDLIMAKVRAAVPELSREQSSAIAADIHRELGGSMVYITKATAEAKVAVLAQSLGAGTSIHDAFAAAAVSRRTGYRLLARRAKPKI